MFSVVYKNMSYTDVTYLHHQIVQLKEGKNSNCHHECRGSPGHLRLQREAQVVELLLNNENQFKKSITKVIDFNNHY